MISYHLNLQVRDVQAEITMVEDVVLPRIPVMKEKEIVMDLEMEANMMETEDVSQGWSVDQTTARSLASTIMRRMTVVRGQEVTIQIQTMATIHMEGQSIH